jgi:hypothetical protein
MCTGFYLHLVLQRSFTTPYKARIYKFAEAHCDQTNAESTLVKFSKEIKISCHQFPQFHLKLAVLDIRGQGKKAPLPKKTFQVENR